MINAAEIELIMRQGELVVAKGKVGIAFDCLVQQAHGLRQTLQLRRTEARADDEGFGMNVQVVSSQISHWFLPDCRLFTRRDFGLELRDYFSSHLTFDCEHVRNITVIPFGPNLAVGTRIDQLRVDANPPARALDGTFQHMRDAERLCDLAQITAGTALVLQCRSAADDFQISSFCQSPDDFVLDSIREVNVLLLTAQIFKRKNSNAFFRRGIESRIFESRLMCEEKCRHAENHDGCDCESGARASPAACLWGTTLQRCCKLVSAGPRGWFECEHRLKQGFKAMRNMRCLELFNG